ncbi:MAG: hypothetical protein KIS66_08285 [Fimbriimonadaceae bacterium]|nr:hypothetical protein [Fimbriimonadaceae bacterium]
MLIPYAALFLALNASPTDLTRVCKAATSVSYDFTFKGAGDDGSKVRAESQFSIHVKAVEKDGRAKADFAAKTFSLKMEDTEMGASGTLPSASVLLDACGMPEELYVDENAWVFMLFECAGSLPGKPLETGETFKVARTKGGEATGTIKFLGLVEVEGKTFLKLETRLEIKPDSDPNPGTLDVVALLDPVDRWPVSIKGTLGIHGQASGAIEFRRRTVSP